MTKRTRFVILVLCAAVFLTAVPYIILYSLGYRVDFEHLKLTATGGIYVRAFPAADQVFIDSGFPQKPGIFNNAVFVQNLLPQNHTVLITKTGFYDYSKTLPVAQNEVTKLENVALFKKDISFEILADKTLSPFSGQKTVPAIKNMLAYATQSDNILWLSSDGFLYQSDLLGKNAVKISQTALKINKSNYYKLAISGQNIFLITGNDLLQFNSQTKNFDAFAENVINAVFSPDSKNLAYNSTSKIKVYSFADQKTDVVFTGSQITDCQWLNNDYLVFVSDSQIIISEIDTRGNVNSITLPSEITLDSGKIISIKSPQIIWNLAEGKLYILTDKTFLVTEKLTP